LGQAHGAVENWKYKYLYTYRFLHTPFSEIPGFAYLYEVKDSAVGTPRTINMSWAQKFGKLGPFDATASTVYRQVIDLGDSTAMHLAMDLGTQQQSLFSTFRSDFRELFDAGQYFRLETPGNEDELKETGVTMKFATHFDE